MCTVKNIIYSCFLYWSVVSSNFVFRTHQEDDNIINVLSIQYVENSQSQQLLKDLSLAICLKIRQPLASRALGQWDTLSCVRHRYPTSGSRRVIMTSIINTDSDSFAGSTSIPSATVSSLCKWTVYTQSWQSALRYCYFASRLHFRINSLRCALCTESWLITFYRKFTLLICYH